MSRLLKLSTTRKAVVNTFGYDIPASQRRMGQYPAIGWGRPAKLIVVKLNLSCPYRQHRLPLRQSRAVYQPRGLPLSQNRTTSMENNSSI